MQGDSEDSDDGRDMTINPGLLDQAYDEMRRDRHEARAAAETRASVEAAQERVAEARAAAEAAEERAVAVERALVVLQAQSATELAAAKEESQRRGKGMDATLAAMKAALEAEKEKVKSLKNEVSATAAKGDAQVAAADEEGGDAWQLGERDVQPDEQVEHAATRPHERRPTTGSRLPKAETPHASWMLSDACSPAMGKPTTQPVQAAEPPSSRCY